jgi:peptide/nickel transport system substrate-binding protein
MVALNRSTKLRMRRLFRRRKQQVEDLGAIADQQLDKHLFRRLLRLVAVRRFVVGWLGLVIALIVGVNLQMVSMAHYYKTAVPVAGGTFTEGIIGSFTNANPLYATGPVDASVSRLIFGSLFKYDENHQLIPDLAASMAVDDTELNYTVTLKPNLTWHDGKPLTAQDVVFTYKMIQNPDARSYLQSSWQGVSVTSPNDRTVVFTLPSKLSAFPHSLTNGIVPQHILGSVPPVQLRSSNFNSAVLVGSGPFKFAQVQVEGQDVSDRQERVALVPFANYYAGPPKLAGFVIRSFRDENGLIASYKDKQIQAMAGLVALPDQLSSDINTREFSISLTGETMVFFKTSQELLQDAQVRKALVLGVDKQTIMSRLPYALTPVNEPLLKSQIGYDPSLAQATGDIAQANATLDAAGWVKDTKTGLRSKAGIPLKFSLYSQANSEYAGVAQSLQKQWRDIGVDAEVVLQSEQDLRTSVSQHSYDALLYSISLGADPDVFAYWHSSQADLRSPTRLNFSEYRSTAADKALEAGRTRSDPTLRSVKYKPFLDAWRADAPALALYQPRFLYVVRYPLAGFNTVSAVSATDRYAHVERWMMREDARPN